MPVPTALVPSSPLVGREREQAILRDRLTALLAGRGSVVLLAGEAGIGKTALAEGLCQEAAAQGALILVGRCYDLAETPPYGLWLDLFAREATTPPPAFAQRGTIGPVASQAALIAQVLDGFAALTAQQPVIVLLDDLHWADPASLDLLRILARHASTHRLILLGTYRADELAQQHPLYTLLPVLVRESQATRLTLHPLTPDDLRAWLAPHYRLGPAETARLLAYLQARAEGNPFYVGELLRALEEEGVLRETQAGWTVGDLLAVPLPPFLRQVIDRRLARLEVGSQRLLSVAAIIGQEVALDLWATVALVDEEVVLGVVEQGVAAQLLRESPDGTRVQFSHALIRATLYEGTLAVRRRRRHRRVAETLLALPTPDLDAIAYHFQQAGDARAADWLIRAGERAQAAYAWTTAVGRYEAALALLANDAARVTDRARLFFQLGLVHRYDNTQRSLECLTTAAQLVIAHEEQALTARIHVFRGLLRYFSHDLIEGLAEMEAGLTALEALPPAERARSVTLSAADATVDRGTFILLVVITGQVTRAKALAEAHLAACPPGATKATLAPYINTFTAMGNVHMLLGRPEEAVRSFERAQELHRSIGHTHLVGHVLFAMLRDVLLPYYADDVAWRKRVTSTIEEAWTRSSRDVALVGARAAWVPALFLAGQWDEARRLCHAARESVKRDTDCFLAEIAYAQGDRGTAEAVISADLPAGVAAPLGSVYYSTVARQFQRLAASLALDAGDFATAHAWLETHDRWLDWSGAVLGRAEGQTAWAQYSRATGDHTQAVAHAERALAHASAPRQPLALLAAHRLRGELATEEQAYADARAHLDAALTLADACAAPYERALTLLALADLCAATGDRASASLTLAEARAILVPLEARPALARADALAARLTPPAPPSTTYPAGLSAREVEVLRLVATGLTNAEIAARLFLSPRTVQSHLRTIFDKLDVTTRSAATRFAVEQRLV